MHRSIEVSAPATQIDSIVLELQNNPHVLGLTRIAGGSLKPVGDSLQLQVLNRGTDGVLKTVRQHVTGASYSVVTAEVASISSPADQARIDDDIDEAIWEELETGLRHNGCITPNYLMLMAIAGVVASIGFVTFIQMQVTAFIAASIIAPGLEPIAKLPVGIVLRKRELLFKGLKATAAGYGVLMVFAAATFLLLQATGEAEAKTFLENEMTESMLGVKLMDVIMSVAAAAASIIMYLSYRRNVIAGPLIALILIPATAASAMCMAIGKWTEAAEILAKTGMEIGIIVAVGCLIMWVKQKQVHRREPLH